MSKQSITVKFLHKFLRFMYLDLLTETKIENRIFKIVN